MSAAFNQGWIYRNRLGPAETGLSLLAFYGTRYRHSDRGVWAERLAAGELHRNGTRLRADVALQAGEQLQWHRPPWQEAAVPGSWQRVFDDGDLLVIDKPSGLPVLPAGGFLEHTLLRLLERRHGGEAGGVPRPVHRLGRFTSGLLVCARRSATRAWLSAQLRESTAGADQRRGAGLTAGEQPCCRKLYRALTAPLPVPLEPGASLTLTTPIGRRPHPLLGQVWCAAAEGQPGALAARSTLTLLERRPGADLVEVAIASGRPHQIRLHAAALGAPLLGDPLYLPGGLARAEVLPGEGGYRLHAHRLVLRRPEGETLELEAPLPEGLRCSGPSR
ncbi:RNA pseudouridine synthase [Cyanobium sp. Morenito 9A2]|nr:RNA pseudouridine synthase [Cyanobium sp. Morenito 9A2]